MAPSLHVAADRDACEALGIQYSFFASQFQTASRIFFLANEGKCGERCIALWTDCVWDRSRLGLAWIRVTSKEEKWCPK
jgi:hypothetical protein